MSKSPEGSRNDIYLQIRKEEVLDQSPLLSLFLDTHEHDEFWMGCMEDTMLKYRKKFKESLGPNWDELVILPLSLLSSENGVLSGFPTGEDKATHERFLSEQLLMMGYEIGPDKALLDLYTNDISHVTESFSIKNSKAELGSINSFIRVSLYTGANLKAKVDGNENVTVTAKSPNLDVYREFINSLDLDTL